MWWWRKVRKAQISKPDRDLFERYGEPVIGNVLAGASCPTAPDLQPIIPGNICLPENPGKCTAARDWLTECRDAHERREQRLEFVEWAVLLFILFEILLGTLSLAQGCNHGTITSRAQAALLDQRDPTTVASTSPATEHKPAPTKPVAQDNSKERTDALESRVKELEEKSADAAKERAYVERTQKEVKDYYEKAFDTQVKFLEWLIILIAAIPIVVGLFGYRTIDRIIEHAVSKATTDLEKKFDEKLAAELKTLKDANAAQMNQLGESLRGRISDLENDLKIRSDFQFELALGMSTLGDEDYARSRQLFRIALKTYKTGKPRKLIDKGLAAVVIQKIFLTIKLEFPDKFAERAKQELGDGLYNDLKDELASAALKVRWLAPLVNDRKDAPPAGQPAAPKAVLATAQESPTPAPDKDQAAQPQDGKEKE